MVYKDTRKRGVLSGYQRGGIGLPGAFVPECIFVDSGTIYLGGRLIDNGNTSRAVLFMASVGRADVWRKANLGAVEAAGGNQFLAIVGIAKSGSAIVALSNTGQIAVTSNAGLTWTARTNIGFTGTNASGIAYSLAASAAGFVAVGRDGQILVTSTPLSTWTKPASPFGSNHINAVRAGALFVAVGEGATLATAPLDNLSAWTLRANPAPSALDVIMESSGRWFVGGLSSGWITSTDGMTWTAPAATPWPSGTVRPRSGYKVGSRWFVHYSAGAFAYSDNDGTSWVRPSNTGLGDEIYSVSAYIGG